MPRRSTGRWVERAASTGGGRTYRGRAPVRWYASLVMIFLLGVALVAYSRYERSHPAAAAQPRIGQKWYTGLAFDICGNLEPDLPANPSTKTAPQILTEGDGVIRAQPTTSAFAGNNATFGKFLGGYRGLEVTPSVLKLPGHGTYRSGGKCPSGSREPGQRAYVQVQTWSTFFGNGSNHPTKTSNPADLKLGNGQLITVAYVRRGAAIPKPTGTTVAALANLFSGTSSSTTTTVPSATTPTSAPATTTTTPATTTTTPATTTTTKP
ncbi:MAG: hypothetical protein ACRDV4_00705 [Acidimicrobiales bacterium]